MNARTRDIESDSIQPGRGVGIQDGLPQGAGAAIARVGDGKDVERAGCQLECANIAMRALRARHAPLVGRCAVRVVARIKRRAARSECHRLCKAAIAGEGAQLRINLRHACGAVIARWPADVIACIGHVAAIVDGGAIEDRVLNGDTAAVGRLAPHCAAELIGRKRIAAEILIVVEGAVVDCDRADTRIDGRVVRRDVADEGAVFHQHRYGVAMDRASHRAGWSGGLGGRVVDECTAVDEGGRAIGIKRTAAEATIVAVEGAVRDCEGRAARSAGDRAAAIVSRIVAERALIYGGRADRIDVNCATLSSTLPINVSIILNPIFLSRKACTATSFAAFKTAGAVPPVRRALYAKSRQGNFPGSGSMNSSFVNWQISREGRGEFHRSG